MQQIQKMVTVKTYLSTHLSDTLPVRWHTASGSVANKNKKEDNLLNY